VASLSLSSSPSFWTSEQRNWELFNCVIEIYGLKEGFGSWIGSADKLANLSLRRLGGFGDDVVEISTRKRVFGDGLGSSFEAEKWLKFLEVMITLKVDFGWGESISWVSRFFVFGSGCKHSILSRKLDQLPFTSIRKVN
jgi:hypothetical protein